MSYVNKYDKNGQCSVDGISAEHLFRSMAESKNFIVMPVSPYVNMNDHIDYEVRKNKRSFTVDVKAMKSMNRGEYATDKFILVEFQNVKGDHGWLYGKATNIAFKMKDRFLIVNRESLAKLAESLVDVNLPPLKATNNKDIYRTYQRDGRQDKFAFILSMDILDNIPYVSWVFE